MGSLAVIRRCLSRKIVCEKETVGQRVAEFRVERRVLEEGSLNGLMRKPRKTTVP